MTDTDLASVYFYPCGTATTLAIRLPAAEKPTVSLPEKWV